MKQDSGMIVGLSLFDTVLDRVSSERADAPAQRSGSWTALRGWNSSFIAAGLRAQPWPSREQRGLAHLADTNELVPPPPPKPAIDTSLFKRLSPEEVAKDINLLASDTPAELQSKRRSFARLNHPDRTPVEWREAATTRMKIANHLVDEALRRI
jgi:hypothetical protein